MLNLFTFENEEIYSYSPQNNLGSYWPCGGISAVRIFDSLYRSTTETGNTTKVYRYLHSHQRSSHRSGASHKNTRN